MRSQLPVGRHGQDRALTTDPWLLRPARRHPDPLHYRLASHHRLPDLVGGGRRSGPPAFSREGPSCQMPRAGRWWVAAGSACGRTGLAGKRPSAQPPPRCRRPPGHRAGALRGAGLGGIDRPLFSAMSSEARATRPRTKPCSKGFSVSSARRRWKRPARRISPALSRAARQACSSSTSARSSARAAGSTPRAVAAPLRFPPAGARPAPAAPGARPGGQRWRLPSAASPPRRPRRDG